MGCYINPADMTKEKWLSLNGEPTAGPAPITETHVPVCLVNNGFFNAAAVVYSPGELNAFTEPTDHRPKLWFLVERAKARTVSDLSNYER